MRVLNVLGQELMEFPSARDRELDKMRQKLREDYETALHQAKVEFERVLQDAETPSEQDDAATWYRNRMVRIKDQYNRGMEWIAKERQFAREMASFPPVPSVHVRKPLLPTPQQLVSKLPPVATKPAKPLPPQTSPRIPAAQLSPVPTPSAAPTSYASQGPESCGPMETWIEGMGCVNMLSIASMPSYGGGTAQTAPTGPSAPPPVPPSMPTYAPTPTLGARFPIKNLGYDGDNEPWRRKSRTIHPFDPAGFGGPQIPVLG